MSEFTKGKWEVNFIYGDHPIVTINGRIVADCFNNEANARLIAAAPELYTFLCDANSFLNRMATDKSITTAIAKSDAGFVDEQTLLNLVDCSTRLWSRIDGEVPEHD